MQNIFWIGEPYFAENLKLCGWENVYIHKLQEYAIYSWDDLLQIGGFIPDVVVAADNSMPPFLIGMETFPCLTVFYSYHSHLQPWQPAFAQGFDACLISQRDHLSLFEGPYLDKSRIWWSPPFAKDFYNPDHSSKPEWDCLYLDKNSGAVNPFSHAVKNLVPGLEIRKDENPQIFTRTRIFLNDALHQEFNFRVFEAQGSGACLVTPRINNGLERIFVDGEHYVGYKPEDAGDAACKINYLLKYPELITHIQKTALKEVNAKHRSRHRAESFTDNLCDLFIGGSQELIEKRLSLPKNIISSSIRELYKSIASEITDEVMKRELIKATNKTI